jgi:hypothetical protein
MRPASSFAVALFALTVSALSSCGGKLPSVAAVEWRIESRPLDKGRSYESLSAFGSIKDEDGIENIEELWIVKDDDSLAWKLTNSNWIKNAEGGDNWIGGSSLALPELGPLPRGAYRMVAIDAAGQRAELGFDLVGEFPARGLPSVSLAKDSIAVDSAWPETLLLAFDAAGAFLSSVAAPKGRVTLEDALGLEIASRTALVGAYGYDPATRMGSFSARVKTR